jgi:hypothetical protein
MRKWINNEIEDAWTPEIEDKWEGVLRNHAPLPEGEIITRVNYYDERPWLNEHDTGSGDEGFVFLTNRRNVYGVVFKTREIVREER